MSHVRVVAGVLSVGDLYLVGQRKGARRHEGCWEFPGGKLEPGESETSALVREWAEELCCVVEPGTRLAPYTNDDEAFTLVPYTIKCARVSHIEAGDSHAQVAWLTLAEIRRLPAVTPSMPFIVAQLTGV